MRFFNGEHDMRVMRQAAVAFVFTATFLVGCAPAETPETLLASAKQYISKNDSKAAIIQLKNALQKNPELAEGRFLLGTLLLSTGDAPGAEKELRKARELKYPADQVVPTLARSMIVLGKYKEVVDEFAAVQVTTPQAKAELLTAIGV